jgi:uncharacterized protein YdhG (YjbR/CyaY superfamily)
MKTTKAKDVDQYIAGFPKEVQKVLEQVRETIRKAAPKAEETISYAIPAYTIHGAYLVYFAGFKNHIGFYPAAIGVDSFKKELSAYKTGRGSVQFPLDKPMPLSLITKMVKYRIKINKEKEKLKKEKQKKSKLKK